MTIENHNHREGLGCIILLIIAVIDFFVSGLIAFVIFVYYLDHQGIHEGFQIAFFLEAHIWLISWIVAFVLIFLIVGGGYFFYWKRGKE